MREAIPAEGRLLLRIRRAHEDRILAQQAIRVVAEAVAIDRSRIVAAAGGDRKRLRGLPAIARGVSGAIDGTDPSRI